MSALRGRSAFGSTAMRRPPPFVAQRAIDPMVLDYLAQRWAEELAAPAVPAPRLATILRALAAVVRAEPYSSSTARPLGAALFDAVASDHVRPGVAWSERRSGVADALGASLRVLRVDGPGPLGVTGVAGRRRLSAALDELAAGFALALATDQPARSVGDLVAQRGYHDAPVGIAVVALDGLVLAANPELTAVLGLGDALAQPRPFTDFAHPDDLPDLLERYGRLIRGDPDVQRMHLRAVRPDGVIVWMRLVASLVRGPDGEPAYVTVVLQDEPERLWSPLTEGSIREQLARLPGASMTEDWLGRAFADGVRRVGICALDLDGFGAVVDAHGAVVGDRLLLAVAGRLRYAAGEHLTTRTGADEFTVLVADPEDVAAVCRVADRLQSALAVPFPVDGRDLVVSASIGVAEGPTEHGCPREMRRAADVARSWAGALGGGRRVVFDTRRDAEEAARYAVVAGLPHAITAGEFRLVYQPLVTLPDARVRGAEALVRWQHPQEGLIGPGRFIDLAEQSGAIVPLGRWVLATACDQAAAWWRELGARAPFVSVNVSPVQLAEPSWVDDVIDVLHATGLPPRQLQLEITERSVLGDGSAVGETLSALRAAGVRLALDDFGTGWSSLAWLRKLPVHALKIDGSFVDGLRHADADAADAAIVAAMVGMAHALGIEVTAEWVETGVQAGRLAALDCDLGQGRWFGDAGPGEWVPDLVRRSMGDDLLI